MHRGDPGDPDRLQGELRMPPQWAQRDWSRSKRKDFPIIPHLTPDPSSLERMCLLLSLGDAGINGIADQSISTAQAWARVIINHWIRMSEFSIKDKTSFRRNMSPLSAMFPLKLIGLIFKKSLLKIG